MDAENDETEKTLIRILYYTVSRVRAAIECTIQSFQSQLNYLLLLIMMGLIGNWSLKAGGSPCFLHPALITQGPATKQKNKTAKPDYSTSTLMNSPAGNSV